MAPISCLILSDTHNKWPYAAEDPAPSVDVFIHCGDLTQYGGLPSFKRAIDNIKSIDAELKIIIAGNHDMDLDQDWIHKYAEDEDDIKTGIDCLSFMKAQKEHRIHFLEEGSHSFTLEDGRSFTVYATPYTPKFGEFAFLYEKGEDRFNEGMHIMPEGVDIVVSHGPPAFSAHSDYKLDVNRQGEHCGCEKLADAIRRARPKLCCFGHIHKGRGVIKMDWVTGKLKEVVGSDQRVKVGGSSKDDDM
ncbi:hypothetical protein N0V94_000435 [Neodidymelliopsis sp. IMI 364377]|nr:hypothetical protein N0V94_000435 [Neodidymelliopsis sp. IMI 364377]